MPLKAFFDAQAAENTKVMQLVPPTFVANVWRSPWVDVEAHRRLTLTLAMNQAGATDGIVLEQSMAASPTGDADAHIVVNGSTQLRVNGGTGQQYHEYALSAERACNYARVVVKHAGVEPTVFFLKLIGAGIT